MSYYSFIDSTEVSNKNTNVIKKSVTKDKFYIKEDPSQDVPGHYKMIQAKCQVIDNGIGRKKTFAKENNIQNGFEYISYGEKITIERLNSFNNRKNKKYGHQVIDLEKGTMVEITIPLLKP